MSFPVRITGSAHSFRAAPEDTLLQAADRAGLARPWRCRDGRCGSCRCHLLAGEVEVETVSGLLRGDAATPPPLLLCRSRARSALELRPRGVATLEDVALRSLELRLVAREALSPDVLRLTLLTAGPGTVRWLPGQYLELLLEDGSRHAFSIANRALGDNRIELHVRRVAGSRFTDWLFDALRPGATLAARGPLGTFVPREDSSRPLLLVAGGTGIAPIKAIISHFADLGARRPMHVYWGTRRAEDLYLDAWLREMAARQPLRYVPVVSAAVPPRGMRAGLVGDAVLADHPALGGFDAYLCGPPAMLDAAVPAFLAAGLPPGQLYRDQHKYAPTLLADIIARRAGLRLEEPGQEQTGARGNSGADRIS